MPPELGAAHTKLNLEWRGVIKWLSPKNARGTPDLLLCQGLSYWIVELKAAISATAKLDIEDNQLLRLNELRKANIPCGVLVLLQSVTNAGGKWIWIAPPFKLNEALYPYQGVQINLTSLPQHAAHGVVQ